MASIDSLKASDGSGNASVATVQNVRSPAATTLVVDTVQGINSTFHATMGTPHTFVDPVTSETITVISEATAVDFQGHVDGTNLEIDTIAPGFTDNGSAVGDIVIIKPTTQWADEVAEVLEVSHNDDGTLKDDTVDTGQLVDEAVTTGKIDDGAVDAEKISTSAIALGYAQITSNFTTSTTGSPVDVPGLSMTVTIPSGGRAYEIYVDGYSISSSHSAGQSVQVIIAEGSNILRRSLKTTPTTGYALAISTGVRITPSAGSHTYKVQVQQSGAGTITLAAQADSPTFISGKLV